MRYLNPVCLIIIAALTLGGCVEDTPEVDLANPGSSTTDSPTTPEPAITQTATPLPTVSPTPPITTAPIATPLPATTQTPISHQSFGLIDHHNWQLDASRNTADLSNAIDDDDDTRWTTKQVQTAGQWLSINLGEVVTFNSITLASEQSPNDSPIAYALYVSDDGLNWGSPIATGNGTAGTTRITFTTQTAGYIKIAQTGSAPKFWWSIHELTLAWESDVATPVPSPLATATSTPSSTAAPSATPAPTDTPVASPEPIPTQQPTILPTPAPTMPGLTLNDVDLANGQIQYQTFCSACHGETGQGSRPIDASIYGSIQALALYNAENMPKGSIGACIEDCANDVAGYMLNGYSVKLTSEPTASPTAVATPAATPSPITTAAPVVGEITRGEELFASLNCGGCHDMATNERQIWNGSDISAITNAIASEALMAAYKNANAANGTNLSDQQLADLAVYIADEVNSLTVTPATKVSSPLARLTNNEFVTSAMTLLNVEATEAITETKNAMGAEADISGLFNDSATQLLTHVAVSGYVKMIDALVDEYFADIATADAMQNLYDCTDTLLVCGKAQAVAIATRAFRRELTTDDITTIESIFDSVTDNYVDNGLSDERWSVDAHQIRFRAAMQYILLSPDFLFLLEEGTENITDTGNTLLSSQEIANRMAFFLTGNLPDTELQAAADNDTLKDADVRAAHADRLLNSALGEAQIADILTAWLGIKTADMPAETMTTFNAFINDWITQNKAFSELYQAAIDVAHLDGSSSSESFGVLGLQAFVASHTHYPTPSFITRGEFVVTRLLCAQLPDDIPLEALASEGLTPVEVFEVHVQDPCASCHRVFDNYGAAFQQFDGESSLFDPNIMDFGNDFDLFDIGDITNEVSDLTDLSMEMGYSNQAPACMSELWYRHALRRNITTADDTALAGIISAWEASGNMNIKSLLRAIVTDDIFISLYQ